MSVYSSYYNELYSGLGHTWNGAASGVLFTDRRDFYIDPYEMAHLYGDVAPFTAFSSGLPVIQTPDPDFKMFEADDHFVDQKFVVNMATPDAWTSSGAIGSTTTIDAADGAQAIALGDNLEGLEVEIRSAAGALKSIALITDYTSGAITFKHISNPEQADNAADALADDDIVYVITNAQAEGSRSPEGWTSQPRAVWNSCGIFKLPFKISGSILAAGLRGWSSELARVRFQKGHEAAIQKERGLLFGARINGNDAPDASQLVDSSGNVIRTTMGLVPSLSRYGSATGDYKNIFTVTASTYGYDAMLDDSAQWFKYMPSGGRLTLIGGLSLVNFFHKFGTNGFVGNSATPQMNFDKRESGSLGYTFSEFVTPAGIIELVYNPLYRGTYAGWGTLVDKSTMQRVQYRPSEYQAGIQENDADYVKDQYFADEGIKITNLRKNALLKLA